MDAKNERSFGRTSLGLLLLYGIVPMMFGIAYLVRARSESVPLITFAALSLLGGVAMVSSALWTMLTRGSSGRALWAAAIASMVSAANLAWAVLTETIPCSGPA
jgi:uncharacterized membrane-anchored protein